MTEETKAFSNNYILSKKIFNKFREKDFRIIKFKIYQTERRFKFEQHMTCSELKKFLPENIYNNYSKITIIRNPYDQALSDYYDMKNRPEHEDVKDFITI